MDRSTLTAKQRDLLKLIHAKSSTIKDYIDSSTYGEDVESNDDGDVEEDINVTPPTPIDRQSTLHPIRRPEDFSGLTESDVRRRNTSQAAFRNTSQSVFRKSTRYLAPEEMAAATDADIDLILQDDVPDPMEEDREFFHRRNTTRMSRARTGRASMDAFMQIEDAEYGEGMEMGDMKVMKSGNTLAVPDQDGRDASPEKSSRSSRSSRLRSRSPVSFRDVEETASRSSKSIDVPRAPSVRPVPPKRKSPPERSKDSVDSKESEASSDSRGDEGQGGLDQAEVNRRMTLPSHPQYIGRTFRSIPRFLSQFVSPRMVAIVCLSITGSITVLNIVLNIAIPQ
jgi:hypothetical protein